MAWRLPPLLPGEATAVFVRRHPAVLGGPAFMVAAGLMALAVASATILREQVALLAILWLGWPILLVRLVWRFIRWRIEYYLITSHRVIACRGLVKRNIIVVPLVQVTDVRLRQGLLGRNLKCGDLIVESISPELPSWTLDHVPHAQHARAQLASMIDNLNAEDALPESAD